MKTGPAFKPGHREKTSSPRVRGQAARPAGRQAGGVRWWGWDTFSQSLTIQFVDLSFVANVTHEVEGIALFILRETQSRRRNKIIQDPDTLRTTHAKNNAKRCLCFCLCFFSFPKPHSCSLVVHNLEWWLLTEGVVSLLQQQDNEIGREMKRIRNHLEFGEAGWIHNERKLVKICDVWGSGEAFRMGSLLLMASPFICGSRPTVNSWDFETPFLTQKKEIKRIETRNRISGEISVIENRRWTFRPWNWWGLAPHPVSQHWEGQTKWP